MIKYEISFRNRNGMAILHYQVSINNMGSGETLFTSSGFVLGSY